MHMLELMNSFSDEPTKHMQQALAALQGTCGFLGAPPGDWRRTELAQSHRDFAKRLGRLRDQLEARMREVPQQISTAHQLIRGGSQARQKRPTVRTDDS